MENVQALVRIAGQELERLVLGCQEVEQREVGDEDDAAAVGEDEEVEEGEGHAVEVVEEGQGQPCENEKGDGVGREGLVENGDGAGLVL